MQSRDGCSGSRVGVRRGTIMEKRNSTRVPLRLCARSATSLREFRYGSARVPLRLLSLGDRSPGELFGNSVVLAVDCESDSRLES